MKKNKEKLDFTNTEIAFKSKTDQALRKSAFLFKTMSKTSFVNLASKGTLWALKFKIPFAQTAIRNTIFEQFCGGQTIDECQPIVDNLYKNKALSILDFGLEGKSNESDFDRVVQETKSAILFAAANKSVPIVSLKISGLAKNELLEKYHDAKSLNTKEEKEWKKLISRAHEIGSFALENKVGVFVDAEESWIQNGIDEIVFELMDSYNKKSPSIYNTYQMYRVDKLAQLKRDHQKAQKDGYFLGAKIVRGAYMVKERKRAGEMGYKSPIQKNKNSTDSDYNKAVEYCVLNYKTLPMCNATHNIESCMLMANLINEIDLPFNHRHLIFCQLYGMSDYITFNLAEAGYNVAKYLPYGPVKEVIPYLIRRAQENVSVTGEMGRELKLINEEIERRRLI